MGKPLSLQGKTIAVTGASGTLGLALLHRLHAEGSRLIALSSKPDPVLIEVEGQQVEIERVQWQVGQEDHLQDLLSRVDILVLNHGLNVHSQRTPDAIEQSYEVNALSVWRLLELFIRQCSPSGVLGKEVWVNTSEAESCPAFSPLYELSKRMIGDLVTLRRLDAPCRIRKLILGPFKSNLNPIGVMSAPWVADQIVNLAYQGQDNIIVTINPLTWIAFPAKETLQSLYFRWFSRAEHKPMATDPAHPPLA